MVCQWVLCACASHIGCWILKRKALSFLSLQECIPACSSMATYWCKIIFQGISSVISFLNWIKRLILYNQFIQNEISNFSTFSHHRVPHRWATKSGTCSFLSSNVRFERSARNFTPSGFTSLAFQIYTLYLSISRVWPLLVCLFPLRSILWQGLT